MILESKNLRPNTFSAGYVRVFLYFFQFRVFVFFLKELISLFLLKFH